MDFITVKQSSIFSFSDGGVFVMTFYVVCLGFFLFSYFILLLLLDNI